jgi:HSP20 family protein
MSLVRFDLTQEMNDLRREVNRAFSGMPLMGAAQVDALERWAPAMDMVERDGALQITLDLPGMKDKDIDVEVRGDELILRGTRTIKREEKGSQWHRIERESGSFERRLQMPAGVDAGAVKAEFDQGVLKVSVPLPKEVEPKARHIAISSGSKS